ncbi:MAG: FecR protein [Cyanobacteria bacterium RYN_339]|nr:FecR protein [Cyanobacteria bacterium RYN_339]
MSNRILAPMAAVLAALALATPGARAAESDAHAAQLAMLGGDAFQAVLTKVVHKVEWQRFRTRAWQPAGINNLLVTGDTLRTGAEAKAELLYGDGSVTRVGSLTSMTLTGEDKRTLRLDSGRVWLHIMKHNAGMKVITPGAVAAVTGTELMVAFDPIKRTTDVTVFEGAVNVTGDVGNLVKVLGGTSTHVPFNAPAAAPLPLDNTKVQERDNIFKPLSVQEDAPTTPKPVVGTNATPAPITTTAPIATQPTAVPEQPKPVEPDLKAQVKPLVDPRVINGSPTYGQVKVIIQ